MINLLFYNLDEQTKNVTNKYEYGDYSFALNSDDISSQGLKDFQLDFKQLKDIKNKEWNYIDFKLINPFHDIKQLNMGLKFFIITGIKVQKSSLFNNIIPQKPQQNIQNAVTTNKIKKITTAGVSNIMLGIQNTINNNIKNKTKPNNNLLQILNPNNNSNTNSNSNIISNSNTNNNLKMSDIEDDILINNNKKNINNNKIQNQQKQTTQSNKSCSFFQQKNLEKQKQPKEKAFITLAQPANKNQRFLGNTLQKTQQLFGIKSKSPQPEQKPKITQKPKNNNNNNNNITPFSKIDQKNNEKQQIHKKKQEIAQQNLDKIMQNNKKQQNQAQQPISKALKPSKTTFNDLKAKANQNLDQFQIQKQQNQEDSFDKIAYENEQDLKFNNQKISNNNSFCDSSDLSYQEKQQNQNTNNKNNNQHYLQYILQDDEDSNKEEKKENQNNMQNIDNNKNDNNNTNKMQIEEQVQETPDECDQELQKALRESLIQFQREQERKKAIREQVLQKQQSFKKQNQFQNNSDISYDPSDISGDRVQKPKYNNNPQFQNIQVIQSSNMLQIPQNQYQKSSKSSQFNKKLTENSDISHISISVSENYKKHLEMGLNSLPECQSSQKQELNTIQEAIKNITNDSDFDLDKKSHISFDTEFEEKMLQMKKKEEEYDIQKLLSTTKDFNQKNNQMLIKENQQFKLDNMKKIESQSIKNNQNNQLNTTQKTNLKHFQKEQFVKPTMNMTESITIDNYSQNYSQSYFQNENIQKLLYPEDFFQGSVEITNSRRVQTIKYDEKQFLIHQYSDFNQKFKQLQQNAEQKRNIIDEKGIFPPDLTNLLKGYNFTILGIGSTDKENAINLGKQLGAQYIQNIEKEQNQQLDFIIIKQQAYIFQKVNIEKIQKKQERKIFILGEKYLQSIKEQNQFLPFEQYAIGKK